MGNPYSKDIENSATIGPAMITLGFSVSAMAMLDMFVPHTLALGENLDAGFSFPFSTSTG